MIQRVFCRVFLVPPMKTALKSSYKEVEILIILDVVSPTIMVFHYYKNYIRPWLHKGCPSPMNRKNQCIQGSPFFGHSRGIHQQRYWFLVCGLARYITRFLTRRYAYVHCAVEQVWTFFKSYLTSGPM